MVDTSWFDDLPEDFEESVRIDRDEQDHRQRAIRSYHMTADSRRRFIEDFVDRMLGQSDDMRNGIKLLALWLLRKWEEPPADRPRWAAGHRLARWTTGRRLVRSGPDLRGQRVRATRRPLANDSRRVLRHPDPVNLLKYQGQKQRSFSEIVLRHAHQDADLTGVDDGISEGLSSQLDVAYFEKWFRTTDAWSDRQARAEAALDGVTTEASDYGVAIRRPLERHPEIWCVGRCRASQALRGGQRDSRWVYRSAAVRHRPRGSSG